MTHVLSTSASTVVVGTDGSPCSDAALAFAADEAERRAAELVVVHSVVPPVVTAAAVTGYLPPPVIDQEAAERAGEAAVFGAIETLCRDHPTLEARPVLAWGSPAKALRGEAEGADLLVVGSHGRGPIGRAVFGSVSESVVHDCPCPVAVVRAPQTSVVGGGAQER